MKRFLITIAVLLLVTGGGVAAYIVTHEPAQRPASSEIIARTHERVARGRYLVENVLDCYGCHTQRDWTRFGAPVSGPTGAGGVCLTEKDGMPGTVCTSNITSDAGTGLGDWTDGEILRALREGVGRDGRALFPFMPFRDYRNLSDEDARAVVAFLRTLPAVRNPVPKPEIAFPVSFLIELEPRPLDGPVPAVDAADAIAYGRYLAGVAGCQGCHTPVDGQHEPLSGQELAGGQDFVGPWGHVRSANLTPHATGIGGHTRDSFIALFRAFGDQKASAIPIQPGANTVMPWFALSGMKDEDLAAIYDYLRTAAPIENRVERFPTLTSHGVPAS